MPLQTEEEAAAGSLGVDLARMMASVPIRRLLNFGGGAVSPADLEKLLDRLGSSR